MNNGRYLTLMDLGRAFFMAQPGLLWRLPKHRYFPVVGAVDIPFLRQLDPFQPFEITTRLLKWDEKWFYLEQGFTAGGKVCAHAYLKALFVGPQGRVKSEEVIRLVERDVPAAPSHWLTERWNLAS
jgi:acyl-CoA thioesterase FadM